MPSATLLAPPPTPVAPQPDATATSKPDPNASYLEVGSFSDASWADEAVKQLSQLGFVAISVHKTHLWVQSYHVEVGPFKSPAEMDAAEKQLAAKGFKSHSVK
jgi:cell division protein FtsN